MIKSILDEDTKFAIKLRVEEYNLDETLLEKLFILFEDNKYNDIDELLEESFNIDVKENDYISNTTGINSQSYLDDLDDLNILRSLTTNGLINTTRNNQLRRQSNLNGIFHSYNNIHSNNIPNPFVLFGNDNIDNNFDPVRVCMTKNSLDNIKDMTYDDIKEKLPNLDENEKCAICWEKLSNLIDELKYYKILPCSHAFHSVCVSEELSNYSYHCPICKKECGDHEAKIEDNDEYTSSDVSDVNSYSDIEIHEFVMTDSE